MLNFLTLLFGLTGCTDPPVQPIETEALPDLPPVVTLDDPIGAEVAPRELTLVLSGELRGEIEPCGCPTLPFGGFERRHRLLAELEARPTPTLQIDTGEAFKKGLVHRDGTDVPRAELIRGLLIEGGLDVFVPGPTDYDVLGVDGLAPLPHVVSATWQGADEQGLFPAYAVLDEGGVRVAVVGLSAPHAELRQKAPIQAARDAIASLPEVDLVVVASNLDEVSNQEIAQNVDGFTLLVTASGEAHDPPRAEGDVLVVEPPPRGRYLSIASFWLASTADQPLDQAGARSRSVDGLNDLREVIALRTSRDEPIDEQQAKLDETVSRLTTELAGRNVVHLDDRALGSDLDGASTATDALADFRQDQLAAAVVRVQDTPQDDGPRYATGAACVQCHTAQVARWTLTPHAKAAHTLRKTANTDNPECVGCHTTAFGEPGGFADLSDAGMRTWGNVQCEACHGPLGGHPSDPSAAPQRINENTCVGCHDEANSPNFDYATYTGQVTCPSDIR